MANKRYDQFSAGTYSTSKIFLQADPASGQLEKVLLPPRGIWGEITGTLSAQTDLQTALNGKEPTITAGTNLQYWRGDKVFATLNTAAVPELTNLYYTNARARLAISLTTAGSSGASTYNNSTGVLNIPNYAVASGILLADGSIPLTAAWLAGPFSIETKQTAAAAATVINGYLLTNTTAASSGNQQYSPALIFEGQGWKTNSTAASQSVKLRQYLVPVQGAASPSASFNWETSINNAGYVAGLNFTYADTSNYMYSVGPSASGIKAGKVSNFSGIWFLQATPSTSNYAMLSDGSFTIFNTPSGTAMYFGVNNSYGIKINPSRGIQMGSYAGTGGTDTATGNIATSGRVSINEITPTAYVHIKVVGTAVAHLRLDVGVTVASPNDGDIWYDGTDLKMRQGATTKTFVLV